MEEWRQRRFVERAIRSMIRVIRKKKREWGRRRARCPALIWRTKWSEEFRSIPRKSDTCGVDGEELALIFLWGVCRLTMTMNVGPCGL